MVYKINGVSDFKQALFQMIVISLIANIFDRLFIDYYWVGKTNAWNIPGTEDLKPYIPASTLIKKWIGTLIFHPLIFLLIAWIVMQFGK